MPTATSFKWDVFLFGARSSADARQRQPLRPDRRQRLLQPRRPVVQPCEPGLLWIETDDGAYTDVTNCMLLAAVPGERWRRRSKTHRDEHRRRRERDVDTYVGEAPGDTKLRRFLVGPKECEITGIAETPDGKTLFVNIQHPGEDTRAELRHPAASAATGPTAARASALGDDRDHQERRRRGR